MPREPAGAAYAPRSIGWTALGEIWVAHEQPHSLRGGHVGLPLGRVRPARHAGPGSGAGPGTKVARAAMGPLRLSREEPDQGVLAGVRQDPICQDRQQWQEDAGAFQRLGQNGQLFSSEILA